MCTHKRVYMNALWFGMCAMHVHACLVSASPTLVDKVVMLPSSSGFHKEPNHVMFLVMFMNLPKPIAS
jgi:hypothetical protein